MAQSIAPSRTLTATFHVFDGIVLGFVQSLQVQSIVDGGNGTSSANALDTAYMDLSTTDAGAS